MVVLIFVSSARHQLMYGASAYCGMSVYTPQFSLVLIMPNHKGMARLSYHAWRHAGRLSVDCFLMFNSQAIFESFTTYAATHV